MKIIALEGIDGSGKTTQSRILYQELKEELKMPVNLYECCSKDNFWGEIIKKLYSAESDSTLSPIGRPRAIQELLYGLCARANFRKINPTSDSIVVSDRSIMTAYASHYGQLPSWYISLLEPRVIPDLVFFLDIEPKVGLERIANRGIRLLDEELGSLVNFRDTYFELMERNRPACLAKVQFKVVDGHQTVEEVHNQIRAELEGYLDLERRVI